jgi:kinesin family protein C1
LIESKATKIKELESQLIIAESQFARAISDCEAAEAKAKSKDQDMSELMKSITDVQSAGQLREEEANKMRREAEAKVSELEKTLATTRGELTVFTHEKGTLRENLDIAKQERADALASLDKVKEQMDKLKSELNSAKSQLTLEKELRARSDLKEREERNERIALSAQMMAMTKEHAQMETYLKENQDVVQSKFKKELDTQIKLVEEKELELQRSNERIVGLLGEIETLQSNLQNEKSVAVAECAQEMSKMSAEISIMKERMKVEEQKYANVNAQSQEKVLALEKQILEAQTERRRMHNLIQELRGNVRVFARCRPFLPDDGVGDDEPPCVVPKSETSLKLLLDGKADKTYNFEFDRVFPPSAGQEAVFTEVSEFVQSALDGYQVCLFSYGQTGSGKTHTMQGSGLGQMRGIIPRSIEQVGAYKEQLERDGWQYDMQVSFLEIYNEAIRDLLRGDDEPPVKLDIKKSADGRRFVQDLNLVSLDPKDSDAVEAIMRQAAKHRAVGCTDMNAVSSRSHSVFTLHLTAKHPENRQSLRGTLNLVDLAGSERLDRSGATGDRQKEAVAINKSLSSLIDVFTAIGNKQSHIPFRNSKLTYLLQPCLCGDGKTLMMVNLSPTELSTQESLCSLRFAANVNKCELGKAKRSLEEIDDDDDDGRSVSSATTSFTYSQARKPVGRASSKISAGSSISKGSMRSPSGKPRAVR